MPLDLNIDGIAIPTDPAALKDLKHDKDLAFQLAAALKPYLDAPLSLVPDTVGGKVAYTSPSAAWTPGDSVVTFGLSGGASGALDVVKTGNLLTYTDGLDSPKTVPVPVPAGHAYVRLTLQFQMPLRLRRRAASPADCTALALPQTRRILTPSPSARPSCRRRPCASPFSRASSRSSFLSRSTFWPV